MFTTYRKTKLLLLSLPLALSLDYFSSSRPLLRNLNTLRCGLHILYSYKIAFSPENCMAIHESIAKDIY